MTNLFDFNEYELLSRRTRADTENDRERQVLNAALGLAGEAGEAVDHIKKEIFHGANVNDINLLRELGDVLYYVSWLANLHGFSLEEVASENVAKLQKRYPAGFKPRSEGT